MATNTQSGGLTRTLTILLLACLCLAGPAHAQDTPERVEKLRGLLLDWEALGKLSKEVMNDVHRWGPNGPYQGVIRDQTAERFAIIETYQLQTQPGVESQLAAFEAQYGKTPQAVDESYAPLLNMEPGKRLPEALEELATKISGTYPVPERLLRETRAELAGLQTTRVQTADFFVTQAKPTLEFLEKARPDQRRPSLLRLEKELRFAVSFDPANAEAKQLLGVVEDKLSASEELLEAWLDEQVFPTPAFEFSGPGEKAELAAACLEWFRASPDWSGAKGEHPFHVVVSGNWVVAKRNILGQPIQWGLPIYLALWKDDKPDLARVFSLTMVTQVAVGVAKSPPWKTCFVGSSYPMRRAKAPGGDSPEAMPTSSSGSGSGSGTSGSSVEGAKAAAKSSSGFGGWTGLACCCTTLLLLGAGVGVFIAANKGKPTMPGAPPAPGAAPPAPGAAPPAPPAAPPAPPA